MHPIRRILVAVKEPGGSALPAVAKGARIARACGAHLELFHALKASVWAQDAAAYETAMEDLHLTGRQQFMQRLDRIAARLRLHGVQVSSAVEYDYPAHEAIIRRAKKTSADLIVASRSKTTRLGRMTDWELLRQSPTPVLLVQRSGPYRHPAIVAAVDPCHAHSKPGDLDVRILGMAQHLAEGLQGKLHAVHAYAPMLMGSAASSVNEAIATRLEGIAAADARMEFTRLLEESNIPLAQRHLIGDLPVAAINAVARRVGARIVVMGALSRSGLKRLIIGNTAEKLLNELPCDILVVKPAEFVSHVPGEMAGPRLRSAGLTH